MTDFSVNNVNFDLETGRLADDIEAIVRGGDVAYVTTSKKKPKRSLSANAQQHVWYKAISEFTGEDLKTTASRMKRDHALPIILADEKHGPLISWMLEQMNFESRRDDKQLIIISGMAITSLFNSRQHTQFRDSMQVFWNAHGLNIDYLHGVK